MLLELFVAPILLSLFLFQRTPTYHLSTLANYSIRFSKNCVGM